MMNIKGTFVTLEQWMKEEPEEVTYFSEIWEQDGFELAGYLKEEYLDHPGVGITAITRIVLKSRTGFNWTPYDTGRKVGNKIIIARFSRYDEFDIKTGKYSFDIDAR